MSSYYDILGVPRGASDEEIKKAYRKMAMKHHPDRNQGGTAEHSKKSEEEFKKAKEAYETLSDPQLRAHYDRFGSSRAGAAGNAGGGFREGFSSRGGFSDDPNVFADLFSQVFSGFGFEREGESLFKRNYSFELPVSLKDCALGTTLNVELPEQLGKVALSITVPPGSLPGSSIQIRQQPAWSGMGIGSVQVVLRAIENESFELQNGRHLKTNIELPIWVACLGGEHVIETLTGSKVSIEIPQGIGSGQVLRVKGQGFPGAAGKPGGDLLCQVKIAVPKKPNKEQIKALEALKKASSK